MFFRNKFGKEQTITVKTPKHIFGRWVYDFQAKKVFYCQQGLLEKDHSKQRSLTLK